MIKFKKDLARNLAPKLYGERVVLSFPKWEDYEEWAFIRKNNKSFLEPFEPKWPQDALSQNFFKRRLERQKKDMEEGRGLFFLIRLNDKIIGGINLNSMQYGAAMQASLGYWLDKDHLKQGYMSESLQLIIDYCFFQLKMNRLNAACLPDNHSSIKLLLKNGFEEEGYAKKYLQIDEVWEDHRLFGLVNQNN